MPKYVDRSNRICVEARHEDGTLNVKAIGSHPDVERCETEDQLFDAYFRAHRDAKTASHEELYNWVASLGLSVRARYW